MGKMIEVEGFKAFRGKMLVYGCEVVYGDWLYKPDTGCWYHGGSSYMERSCKVLEVE